MNLIIISDILTFLATICWLEFSQSVLNEAGNREFTMSPLWVFSHHCDSRFTVLWIQLFNLSALVAMVIMSLCIYAVHQTTFSPSAMFLLVFTVVAFTSMSLSPVIAFISFFKLSIVVLCAASWTTVNIIPAICSEHIWIPNIYCPSSDRFNRALFRFLYPQTKADSVCGGDLVDGESSQRTEYKLRVGIANKVLAEHYALSFWLPLSEKNITESLMTATFAECTPRFVRGLRGCTLRNVAGSITQTLCSGKAQTHCTVHDKVLDLQYLVMMFVFVPIQTVFALYGLVYPYMISYQWIASLIAFHGDPDSMDHADNEVVRVLLTTKLAASGSVLESLVAIMSGSTCFKVFLVSVIGHLLTISLVVVKLWRLRPLFEMCLDVMIVEDVPLDEMLVDKMARTRNAIECVQVCEEELDGLLGRYHLDKEVMEFVGGFMEEAEYDRSDGQ